MKMNHYDSNVVSDCSTVWSRHMNQLVDHTLLSTQTLPQQTSGSIFTRLHLLSTSEPGETRLSVERLSFRVRLFSQPDHCSISPHNPLVASTRNRSFFSTFLVLTTGSAVRYVIEKLYENFIVIFDIKDRMYIILASLWPHKTMWFQEDRTKCLHCYEEKLVMIVITVTQAHTLTIK